VDEWDIKGIPLIHSTTHLLNQQKTPPRKAGAFVIRWMFI
jgi:hypothetical protein